MSTHHTVRKTLFLSQEFKKSTSRNYELLCAQFTEHMSLCFRRKYTTTATADDYDNNNNGQDHYYSMVLPAPGPPLTCSTKVSLRSSYHHPYRPRSKQWSCSTLVLSWGNSMIKSLHLMKRLTTPNHVTSQVPGLIHSFHYSLMQPPSRAL